MSSTTQETSDLFLGSSPLTNNFNRQDRVHRQTLLFAILGSYEYIQVSSLTMLYTYFKRLLSNFFYFLTPNYAEFIRNKSFSRNHTKSFVLQSTVCQETSYLSVSHMPIFFNLITHIIDVYRNDI